jgi:hypothetical protein
MRLVDFYLSEMSVSDGHGGGLTLQRVLGEDLDSISRFVHVNRFARVFPPIERVQPRCLDLPMWLENPRVREWIGCRPTAWLSGQRCVRRHHARRAARVMLSHCGPINHVLRGVVCPQGIQSLLVLEELKQRAAVRYITWIMDDHLVRFRDGEWRYPPQVEALLARHLKEAEVVFVISPAMVDFYRQRFGVEPTVLLPPAITGNEPVWSPSSEAGPCRLGYFGNLGPWVLNALNQIASILPRVGATVDVFGPAGQAPGTLASPGIRLCGTLSKEHLLSQMRKYDAVILPISFAEEERHLAEFNIATRMSEFLASGNLTLLVGPSYAAMIRYLESKSAACIVTNPNSAELARAFNLIRNTAYRREVLMNARNLVAAELSTATMRSKWQSASHRLASEVSTAFQANRIVGK